MSLSEGCSFSQSAPGAVQIFSRPCYCRPYHQSGGRPLEFYNLQHDAHRNEKLCEKNSHKASFAKKQNVKHNMEKLCEKQKQHRSSMISLLRSVEEIL